MENLNGIWWTYNKKKIVGNLTITKENRIYLTTFERIEELGIINGMIGTEKFTLVDAFLDTTENYYDNPKDKNIIYSTYRYVVNLLIKGYLYERIGDIRLKEIWIQYTNINEWADLNIEEFKVKDKEQKLLLEFNKPLVKRFDVNKFNVAIIHRLAKNDYIQINNNAEVLINNIKSKYINSCISSIELIQYFMILCMGINSNIENVEAIDENENKIEIIIRGGKTEFYSKSLFKNIIKYKDIEENFAEILKNWIKLYEENELLVANFMNLQRREELLISEYISAMTCIDSLHLMVTNKEKTNENLKDILEKLLKETNFILNLTEKQIKELSNEIKDIRRYFVHSNKTQRDLAINNMSNVRNIVIVLIEIIRARIMMHIGVKKEIINDYYNNLEVLKSIKQDIVTRANDDEKIYDYTEEERKIVKTLSKKDKEYIAELNSHMRTRYRETNYHLDNSEDLIEAATKIAAEYMDYSHYSGLLSHIGEEFDQSLEVFNPQRWMRLTKENGTGDYITDEIISSVRYSEDLMYELCFETEKRCIEIWEYLLLGNDEKAKKYFVGDISKYNEEEIKNALMETIEYIFEIPYNNQVEQDGKSFGNSVKQNLKKFKEKKQINII